MTIRIRLDLPIKTESVGGASFNEAHIYWIMEGGILGGGKLKLGGDKSSLFHPGLRTLMA